MMQTKVPTKVSRRHSFAGSTPLQISMGARRRNSMNYDDSLSRTNHRCLTFIEPTLLKKEKSYMKINRKATLFFQKEQFAKAGELFDEASKECLRRVPMEILREISRRSVSQSTMPMPRSISQKIRSSETKFYEKTIGLLDEDCSAMAASVLLFNVAQCKRRANDFKGAFECYQRSFFVYPKETSRVLVPILFNASLILHSLVGNTGVPTLLCNFFGDEAKKWFCSPNSFLPEKKVKDEESTAISQSSSSLSTASGSDDSETRGLRPLRFGRRATADTTSNKVPTKSTVRRRVTISHMLNQNSSPLSATRKFRKRIESTGNFEKLVI